MIWSFGPKAWITVPAAGIGLSFAPEHIRSEKGVTQPSFIPFHPVVVSFRRFSRDRRRKGSNWTAKRCCVGSTRVPCSFHTVKKDIGMAWLEFFIALASALVALKRAMGE
jgi:hypothetical protein